MQANTWTDAQIREAAESNLYHPEDAVLREDHRRLLVHMPADWGYSVVQRSHVTTDTQALALIDEIVEEARERRPASPSEQLHWWIRASTQPADMATLLEQRGFTRMEQAEILGLELATKQGPSPHSSRHPSHEWGLIRNLADMETAHNMRLRAIGSESTPGPFDAQEAASDLQALKRLEHHHYLENPRFTLTPATLPGQAGLSVELLAYEGGQPVATAAFTTNGLVANFWGAATEEAHRGRGAYHTLVYARCSIARRLGATLALVKARPATSGPLLKHIGFRHAGEQICYAISLYPRNRARGDEPRAVDVS